jgi:hypothetical protein
MNYYLSLVAHYRQLVSTVKELKARFPNHDGRQLHEEWLRSPKSIQIMFPPFLYRGYSIKINHHILMLLAWFPTTDHTCGGRTVHVNRKKLTAIFQGRQSDTSHALTCGYGPIDNPFSHVIYYRDNMAIIQDGDLTVYSTPDHLYIYTEGLLTAFWRNGGSRTQAVDQKTV